MLRDNESVERLKNMYKEANDVELHRNLAIALGLIGDRSITRDMYGLLKDSTPDLTRIATAYNLGLIGDKNALDPLLKVASNKKENARMRTFAILGLGLISDDNPWPAISRFTRDHNYTILDNFMCELYNIN
jgi:HEAT repeat protein